MSEFNKKRGGVSRVAIYSEFWMAATPTNIVRMSFARKLRISPSSECRDGRVENVTGFRREVGTLAGDAIAEKVGERGKVHHNSEEGRSPPTRRTFAIRKAVPRRQLPQILSWNIMLGDKRTGRGNDTYTWSERKTLGRRFVTRRFTRRALSDDGRVLVALIGGNTRGPVAASGDNGTDDTGACQPVNDDNDTMINAVETDTSVNE